MWIFPLALGDTASAMTHSMPWISQKPPSGHQGFPTPPPPSPPTFFSLKQGLSACKSFKGDTLHSQYMTPLQNSKGPGKRQKSQIWREISHEVKSQWNLLMWTLQKSKAFTLSLAGWDELPGTQREWKNVLCDRETDKLPDIMGPILPLLDQENKTPDAINGTVAKRSNVEIWGRGERRIFTWNIFLLLKALKMDFLSWRWGWRLKRKQLPS